MKIRPDSVFISTVLFTVALLGLVPSQWKGALETPHTHTDVFATISTGLIHDRGVANLATISIALIVLWTGYLKGLRSAWFVMFIVAWIWFFPQTKLWIINYSNMSETIRIAAKEPGGARSFLELLTTLTLMVIALLLPIKSFFWKKNL